MLISSLFYILNETQMKIKNLSNKALPLLLTLCALAPQAWAVSAERGAAFQNLETWASDYNIAPNAVVLAARATQVDAPKIDDAQTTPAPTLPSRFFIKERFFALTDTFDIISESGNMGSVKEKFFSLTKAFRYVDENGNCLALARARLFSWGTHIDVTDCQTPNPHKIGSIKEKVLKTITGLGITNLYLIYDGNGRKIALSKKVEVLSTDIALRDTQGRKIAELKRPWLNFFRDSWTVTISNPQAVDSRLIVLIAAYKTSVDNDRRRQQSQDDNNRKH